MCVSDNLCSSKPTECVNVLSTYACALGTDSGGAYFFKTAVFHGGTLMLGKEFGGPRAYGGTWVKITHFGGTYFHNLQQKFSPHQSH